MMNPLNFPEVLLKASDLFTKFPMVLHMVPVVPQFTVAALVVVLGVGVKPGGVKGGWACAV